MTPVTPSSDNPMSQGGNQFSRSIIYLAIFLVVIAGAAAILWRQSYHSAKSPKPVQNAYSLSFTRLQDYSLKGPAPGSSETFLKPAELNQDLLDASSNQTTLLKSQQFPIVSRIDASIVSSPSSTTPENISKFAAAITNPGNPDYKIRLAALQFYVNERQTPFYAAAVIEQPKAFKSPNIKSNAWIADFSISPKSQQPTAINSKNQAGGDPAKLKQAQAKTGIRQLPDLKGKVLIIFGKSTIYYFMVADSPDNWQVNDSSWQKIIDSLKIDQ